mmetsp:Transcript_7230/g.17880  ORF Transcript_7230/g.17880 Transcript_7230/m.17880 type:complete len:219 (-) Transcript_7230:47-703(-)
MQKPARLALAQACCPGLLDSPGRPPAAPKQAPHLCFCTDCTGASDGPLGDCSQAHQVTTRPLGCLAAVWLSVWLHLPGCCLRLSTPCTVSASAAAGTPLAAETPAQGQLSGHSQVLWLPCLGCAQPATECPVMPGWEAIASPGAEVTGCPVPAAAPPALTSAGCPAACGWSSETVDASGTVSQLHQTPQGWRLRCCVGARQRWACLLQLQPAQSGAAA